MTGGRRTGRRTRADLAPEVLAELAAEHGLRAGTVHVHPDGYAFLVEPGRTTRGDDLFIGGAGLRPAMHGDTVVVRARHTRRGRFERVDGQVVKVVTRRWERLLGVCRQGRSGAYLIPQDPRILYGCRLIAHRRRPTTATWWRRRSPSTRGRTTTSKRAWRPCSGRRATPGRDRSGDPPPRAADRVPARRPRRGGAHSVHDRRGDDRRARHRPPGARDQSPPVARLGDRPRAARPPRPAARHDRRRDRARLRRRRRRAARSGGRHAPPGRDRRRLRLRAARERPRPRGAGPRHQRLLPRSRAADAARGAFERHLQPRIPASTAWCKPCSSTAIATARCSAPRSSRA